MGDDNNKSFKHMCKNIRRCFRGGRRGGGWFPFFSGPCPWYFCPKVVVGGMILLALLLCGVNIYGVLIIILLILLFVLV
ncbi:hypothetical protein [Clostridium taeniosporum]|uniref:Uncharacterized protein n=1 Tax=Clostridium taeniosporum TaxID=394958 RepID=A0A1D7XI35_9CLOT|nr:hypothetical protein [Clostridium taeniosporum]AOR23003.1 hypothetical protein BGI42_04390 [Clostridium taeniosporum]